MMNDDVKRIDISDTDIWTTLFDRKFKPFEDSQVLYTTPTLSTSYTYASLSHTTISFGTGLRKSFGFKKGDVLTLLAQNCIDTPAVTWGTHFAGGIVSPANPAYTIQELVHHLQDSGTKVLVTQPQLLKPAVEACRQVGISSSCILLIGEDKTSINGVRHFSSVWMKGGKVEDKELINPKDDLAYLVYSSGTTGLPKGVMLSHENSVSDLFMVASLEGELLKCGEDKVLSVLPYYHIYGLQCLVHLPCFLGIETVVMPKFEIKDFCQIIQDRRITYTYVAPPVVLHLAKSPVVEEYDLSSLKTITSGAAPLTKELIFAVKKRLGVEVKQAYGLSETSPVTHIQKKWNIALGSVGPPLPNQTVLFMDTEGKEVPHGKDGEIWIKGPNVFKGYLNNDKATSESLTSDGFFKTGDIGYRDDAGNMFITDRVKELIKYKGFQVAPAELEGLLMGNEMVEDVAVVGIYDKRRETEVPVACVVLAKGFERCIETENRIVKWVAERVAGHKQLRGGVRWVDVVPKSASGKILRRKLRDWLKKETKEIKPKL